MRLTNFENVGICNMTPYLYEISYDTSDRRSFGFSFRDAPSCLGNKYRLDDFFTKKPATNRNWSIIPLTPVWNRVRVFGKSSPEFDYPCIGMMAPCFSRRAVDCLKPMLLENGELLEVESDYGVYYAYNVLTIADVLDAEKCIGLRRSSCPTLFTAMDRFVLRQDVEALPAIFRVPELISHYFVNSAFVDRVKECQLKGFMFVELTTREKKDIEKS